MINYYVGYKQADGKYVYVTSINEYAINMTLDTDNAIDVFNEDMAKNICEYLNKRDEEKTYIPLMVKIDVTEVIENDVITSE